MVETSDSQSVSFATFPVCVQSATPVPASEGTSGAGARAPLPPEAAAALAGRAAFGLAWLNGEQCSANTTRHTWETSETRREAGCLNVVVFCADKARYDKLLFIAAERKWRGDFEPSQRHIAAVRGAAAAASGSAPSATPTTSAATGGASGVNPLSLSFPLTRDGGVRFQKFTADLTHFASLEEDPIETGVCVALCSLPGPGLKPMALGYVAG